MKIETLPTETLVPYARNSRTHSDEQIAQIMASIREFGFCNPVLIDADNGIIAGHGRVMAAQRMQLKEVPCIRLGHLTEAQKRAYVIADNKIAMNSGWDEDALKIELELLNSEDFDFSSLGFSAEELTKMMYPEEEPELKQVKIMQPPAMSWALIGIPTVRYGEISSQMEQIAKIEGVTLETTSNDG